MYPMLAFIHIHKCGGSSLQELIRSNFRGRSDGQIQLDDLDGRVPEDLVKSIQGRALSDGYIMGHFAYGVHRLFAEHCEYATFLRKPVPRLISLYRHAKITPNAYYHHQANDRSFEEFLTNGSVLEADNGMVRFLSGDPEGRNIFINPKKFGELDETDLARAIENLKFRIAAFGLLERFDESLLVFNRKIGLKKCCYTRVNETPPDVEKPVFRPSCSHLVALDDILYEQAEILFEKRLQKLGLADGQILSAFRAKNRRMRPWLTLRAKVKYGLKRVVHR